MKKSLLVLTAVLTVVSGCCIGVMDFDDLDWTASSGKDTDTNYIQIGDTEKTSSITNVVTNTVTNTMSMIAVVLTAPANHGYVPEFFTVSGTASNVESIDSAVICVETPAGAIVSSGYSAIERNSFSAEVEISQEGIYRIWATVWNMEGIGRSDMVEITADWSAPLCTIVSPQEGQNSVTENGVTVTGTAYDAVSGLQGVYYSLDGGGFYPCEGTTNWSVTVYTGCGSHQIEVYALDKAGYVSPTQTVYVGGEEYDY